MRRARTDTRRAPADQAVRDQLVTTFDRNFLVEAGAGSGKTHSLATRMAAGIEAGHFRVEHMAAVTFTRKAASELRGRFQLALEDRLRAGPSDAARERLETALAGIERLFAGTIHAFCAHLLRERPVDACVAPGFVELDDVQDAQARQRAWRDYVADARARGVAPMLELLDAGIRPRDLDGACAALCEHEDVVFDAGDARAPDFASTLEAVERFWRALARVKPADVDPEAKCKALSKCDEFGARLGAVRRTRSLTRLAGLLTFWNGTPVTMKWWNGAHGGSDDGAEQARRLVEAFQAGTVAPFVEAWRAYVHRLAITVLVEAREAYARERRRLNAVNYVDLLRMTAAMLRERADVRRALQDKYRWLFIDEFQDTDPIQADVFLLLAADEITGQSPSSERGGNRAGTGGAADPFALPLRPGALFVVGDPKQSIFRFRRADIDIYTRVARRIVETGGQVLALSANFRSLPPICEMANTVFAPLFGGVGAPYSPAFTPLVPVREDDDAPAGPRIATITVPFEKSEVVQRQAEHIAAFIHAEVAAGRRAFGDFLVITRGKPRLVHYVEALDSLEIPVEVSGAGLFCTSAEVRALSLLFRALADPLDGIALVGVLRGPFFGLSDPDLFRFRQAGGRFDLLAPLPEPADADAERERAATWGPALGALRELRTLWQLTRRLPLAAALDLILERTGWLALAATTPGGARAGHLLQAVDEVRQVVEQGGGLTDAADLLADESPSTESEAWPLEPGRRDVVRLMNLHKAKGLEAPVVILADAANAFEHPVSVRIERTGGAARGHVKIARKNETHYGETVLAQPSGWAAYEAEEQQYLDAERLRLLYVAGTRAQDQLVVCRTDDAAKNKAWDVFETFLEEHPGLKVRPHKPAASRVAADLSSKARRAAEEARALRDVRLREAGWALASPTGEKARLTAAARAREIAVDPAAVAHAADTAAHRADAGAAWGTLLHGLLEHAMRHEASARDDLARLARWLTVEHDDLRPFIGEALDWVDDVRRLPFWGEARAAGQDCLVEVPFAVRLDEPAGGTPTVLRGVIDLIYRTDAGWRLVDYKSDRLDGVVDIEAELRARHGEQLAEYADAWQRVTGARVTARDVVWLRTGRVVSVGDGQA